MKYENLLNVAWELLYAQRSKYRLIELAQLIGTFFVKIVWHGL